MAYTYEDLLKRLTKMTPQQLAQPVVAWNVATNDVLIIDDIDVAGEEEPDEVCPNSDEVKPGQPYFIAGIE